VVGGLFESLVALDVRVYAQAAEASVSHLRTRNGGHEVDLIVEGPAGRVLALEVKLAPTVGTKTFAICIGCANESAATCSTQRSSRPALTRTAAATESP